MQYKVLHINIISHSYSDKKGKKGALQLNNVNFIFETNKLMFLFTVLSSIPNFSAISIVVIYCIYITFIIKENKDNIGVS